MTITPPSNKLTEGDKQSFKKNHEKFILWALTQEGREKLKLTPEQIKRYTEEAERLSKLGEGEY